MNLFELFVKIGVDDQASGKLSNLSKKLGNGLKTAAKIGTAAVATAAAGITALTTAAINGFSEYEQLAGGAQKIFDQMDYSKIATDANNAYKELGLSANQYLAVINDVGATFAATMGDEAGYEAAKTGLKAISDYASGTGKNVDELSSKFTLITRSTSSYQSIADQFSGILPATSKEFLKQAQAAGLLNKKYKDLTKVPIAEYQEAVSKMLEQGVSDLGLANNTMDEAFSTLSGSLSMAKGAWSNLVTGLADDSADLDMLIGNFVESVGAVATNLIPKIGTALNGASKLVQDLIPVIVQEIPVLIEENLPILAEAAVSIIQSLIDGISENQEMLFNTIFDVITYLAESFITLLPSIVSLGLDLLVALVTGVSENIDELIPLASEVVGKIVSSIIENAPRLAEAAFGIIDELGNSLAEQIPGLSWVFENLETVIVAVTVAMVAYKAAMAISSVIETLTKATEGQTIAQLLLNAAMKANPLALVAGLVAGLVAAIVTLWNTNEGFRAAVIAAWEGIQNAFAAAWSLVTELWGSAGEFFSGVWKKIKSAFSTVGSWFSEKFTSAKNLATNAWSDIKTRFSKVWSNIQSAFATVGSWFSTTFTNAKNSVTNAWSDIKSKFSAFWKDIQSVFSGAKDTFKSIGNNIVNGAWQGIKDKAGAFKQNVKNFFSGIVKSVKSSLGIRSPSRVFAEIGGYMAQGVSVGWDNEFSSVKNGIDKSLDFDDANMRINASVKKTSLSADESASGSNYFGNITINIDGAKYSDEQSLAMAVAEVLQNMTERKAAVYA